ncbi:PREDICTED: jmjC domain-containing histone demethylation protein 1 [Habropoda laboriosa]|uniref:jmjC domain-containing histone demethylation protein 1 n=1 Tax=Habropoda laboriosa TaxID=597456 RepID=UPI00083CF579|nr:PREDICTED: jmjC domain-containing histone demethylation protein 1 [Habropoda laboriosa]
MPYLLHHEFLCTSLLCYVINADSSSYAIKDHRSNVDPSIEQIFRGPNDRSSSVSSSKRNVPIENAKSAQSEEIGKRGRVKRENAGKRSDSKNLIEASRKDEKRSVSKAGDPTSRTSRSSRDLPNLPAKDYEIPLDRDKSEYSDVAEDDSSSGSKNKEGKYKGGEINVKEDSERFIDQEERSSLYDDFEAKDVVKRGISGVEDYEEMEDDPFGAAEDAALDDGQISDEEVDKKKVHSDVRVKRQHENLKDSGIVEISGKAENPGASSNLINDEKSQEASLKQDSVSDRDSKIAETQVSKDSTDQGEQLKRNVAEKSENDASKISSDRDADNSKLSLITSDQSEIESNENTKLLNRDIPDASGDRKTQEAGLSSNTKGLSDIVSEPSSLKGGSKVDESKIAEIQTPEAVKIEVLANSAEAAPVEDSEKLESSRNEVAAKEQLDGDYEKRVEEQIQRRIDSIKEEIKREIAENRRMKEIEENNDKFDELREEEDEDEEQAMEYEPSEKQDSLSKRSLRNSGKSQVRENTEKKAVKRKKRQGDGAREKVQGSKKSREMKKRSVGKSESEDAAALTETARKREFPRQAYLVRTDRKKKRKRRRAFRATSRSIRACAEILTIQSKVSEDEKATAEQESLAEKRSGSVASLTGNGEETGPLATEYGEAFGGLNGEPGMALARFKRIKRVLGPQASKTLG